MSWMLLISLRRNLPFDESKSDGCRFSSRRRSFTAGTAFEIGCYRSVVSKCCLFVAVRWNSKFSFMLCSLLLLPSSSGSKYIAASGSKYIAATPTNRQERSESRWWVLQINLCRDADAITSNVLTWHARADVGEWNIFRFHCPLPSLRS